ncbi:hypothetical protein [Calothrix rhizosoleniae]|uniref:hypothetical protein n=1 Tax=Calothrix rhizosoleniae TaxID=888997 RepID=UPI0013564FD2|nr:hypothetical protein [Calothrix rhizosoleniae]
MDFQIKRLGIAQLWDDLDFFGTIYQWFQPPIHPHFLYNAHIFSGISVICDQLSTWP